MAKNEAAVIGGVVEHLYREGCDQVIVEDGHSTDRTRWAALNAGAIVVDEQDRAYDQADRMTRLVAEWCEPGDWFIPFDADEYWYSDLGTIREALEATDATQCPARMWLHKDWDYRAKHPKPLPKVAFKYQPGCQIAFGNHAVDGIPGESRYGVLELREWQYRSFDHFLEKIEKQRELIANTPNLVGTFATHKAVLLGLTDAQLEAEWQKMMGLEWVFDPIPSLSSPPSTPTRSS